MLRNSNHAFVFILGILAIIFSFSSRFVDTTQAANHGDIIINEIMWMGSNGTGGGGDASDEWLELRNMTGSAINFATTPFTIEKNTGSGYSLMTTINSGIISANGYFVISRLSAVNSRLITSDFVDPSLSLDNSDVSYQIKDDLGNILDEIEDGSGAPFAGTYSLPSTIFSSMERNNDPDDGTLASDWHTASQSSGFDSSTPEKGTPGVENTPVTPTNIIVTASSAPAVNSGLGEIDVSFDVTGNDSNNLTFNVYESVSGNPFTNINGSITLNLGAFPLVTFTRSNLDDSTLYEYKIQTINVNGLESNDSSTSGDTTLDRTAPTFTIVHPGNGRTKNSLSITYQFTQSESGTYTYLIDSNPGSCLAPLANTLIANPSYVMIYPLEGNQTTYVCLQDSEGNYSSVQSVTFPIDVIPAITITNLTNGQTISTNSFTLQTSIYENLVLSSATYRIDGASVLGCRSITGQPRNLGNALTVSGSSPNYTTSNLITGLSDGQHIAWVCAGTAAYNQVSLPTSSTFTVDTTGPYFDPITYDHFTRDTTVPATFEVGDINADADPTTITVTLDDGITSTLYSVANNDITCTGPVSGIYSCSVTWENLVEGNTYDVTFSATDTLGNTSDTVDSLVIDIEYPLVNSWTFDNGSVVDYTDVPFFDGIYSVAVTATDNDQVSAINLYYRPEDSQNWSTALPLINTSGSLWEVAWSTVLLDPSDDYSIKIIASDRVSNDTVLQIDDHIMDHEDPLFTIDFGAPINSQITGNSTETEIFVFWTEAQDDIDDTYNLANHGSINDSYRIEYGISGSFDDSTTITGSIHNTLITTYLGAPLVDGVVYEFRVIAIDWTGNESPPSDTLTISLDSNVPALSLGNISYSLSIYSSGFQGAWEQLSNNTIDLYNIYFRENPPSYYSGVLATIDHNTDIQKTYNFPDLTLGTYYCSQVSAIYPMEIGTTNVFMNFEKFSNEVCRRYFHGGGSDTVNPGDFSGGGGGGGGKFTPLNVAKKELENQAPCLYTFTDIDKNPYKEAINSVCSLGIMTGISQNDGSRIFNPRGNLSRAELAKILIVGINGSNQDFTGYYGTEPAFPDISRFTWQNGATYIAKSMKLMNGYENGNFGPDDSSKHLEIIKSLIDVSKLPIEKNEISSIQLSPTLSLTDWQKKYLKAALYYKIIATPSTFHSPNSPLPRDLIASYILKTLEAKRAYELSPKE